MTYAAFQRAIAERFPGCTFRFDKDLRHMYASTSGLNVTLQRAAGAHPWEIVLSTNTADVTDNGATLTEALDRICDGLAKLNDVARTFGLTPHPQTAAIQAHNAAIEQRIAAMTPEERAEREQRLRDAIAARVGTPKETP